MLCLLKNTGCCLSSGGYCVKGTVQRSGKAALVRSSSLLERDLFVPLVAGRELTL